MCRITHYLFQQRAAPSCGRMQSAILLLQHIDLVIRKHQLLCQQHHFRFCFVFRTGRCSSFCTGHGGTKRNSFSSQGCRR